MKSEPRLCKCHGEPMFLDHSSWCCAVRRREVTRRYREKNRAKLAQAMRRWRAENPDEKREENARRLFAGRMYLGTCGFTKAETEAMLDGTS